YRAPLLDWWLVLTDGFKKGRLVVEKEAQTLVQVKRWVSQSVASMLAVIWEDPSSGPTWLRQEIGAGKHRWNEKHRRLLDTAPRANQSTPQQKPSNPDHVGGDADAPFQGGEGVS
ncbi:MAG: hypothetical protein AABZ61_14015, partial [Bacteroidota bacterium]